MSILVIDSSNSGECIRALNTICSSIDILCYDPSNDIEPLISLSWIETLSYIESFMECIEDSYCSRNVLNSFGETLKLALEKSYIFRIYIERIARVSKELKKISI